MRLEGKSLRIDFFKFIIPAMVAQIVFSLYSMVDGMFVAHGVGEVALSAINISAPFVMFLFAIALIFAIGSSTIIAMDIGEGNREKANTMYSQNMFTVVMAGLIIAVIVALFNDQIASFLGATDSTIEYVKTYITTIAIFAVFFIASYTFEVLIMTDGYPVYATIIVTLGVVLNIALDYVLVIKMDEGVFGAAIATCISQCIVICLYLNHFLGKKTQMKLIKFKFSGKALIRTVKIGLAAGITELSPGIVIFLFNHAILTYIGEEALVSYTIIAYVNSILIYGITGVSQGISPLVSYHYGGGRIHKCRKLLKYALVFSAGLATIAFFAVRVFDEGVVGLFISPDLVQLREYSSYALDIFSVSFLLVWINVVIGGYLTAVESVKSSVLISLGRGLVFVAINLLLFTRLIGGDGIWWSAVSTEFMCVVMACYLLKRVIKQKGV